MRNVEFLGGFRKTYLKFNPHERAEIDSAIERLLGSLEDGQLPKGLGLKKITNDLWEIRVGLDVRVGFWVRADLILFGVVGTHDDIRKFIRRWA